MKLKRLPHKFVLIWLLFTTAFVTAWGMYLAFKTENPSWVFLGALGGMVMLYPHLEIEGKDTHNTELFFWTFLTTLLIIVINMALASHGLVEDTFGLLG